MATFNIPAVGTIQKQQLRRKIDTKTKPLGALGTLEALALQAGLIQKTLKPRLNAPTVIVFAGDHGIAAEKVSAYPQAVTAQMVQNFLNGGAAINVFARQHGLKLLIVNAGVARDLPNAPGLINVPMGKGTKNFLHQPAMSIEECELAIQKGARIVQQQHQSGCNIIAFGEMGIGNTSSAAMIMSSICKLPTSECVGRGTGLTDQQLASKQSILNRAHAVHGNQHDPLQILATYGGFETAMVTGAILQAAELRMIILIDGFIVSSALLVAHAIHKHVLDYCVFTHASNEHGHERMLEFLGAEPLLNLGLRLGEGTGAALAFPLVASSVGFINEMASFESAHVSGKN